MSRTVRRAAAIATFLLVLVTLAGCNQDPVTTPADGASTTTAAAPSKPPAEGACYLLDIAAALQTTNTAPAVRCSRKHNAVTVAVGKVRPVVGGKLLPIDSARVQQQIADKCRTAVDGHVGGTDEEQRLSRIQAVWFSPSAADFAAGARWFRCDLVIGSTRASFATLPRRTSGLLDAPGALDRYGICGTSAPGARGFVRVLCADAHRWRARATITLPAGTRYLAKAAGRKADSTCRDIEAARSTTSLKLRWAFEWPTQVQWQAGQRYGLCWTPTS